MVTEGPDAGEAGLSGEGLREALARLPCADPNHGHNLSPARCLVLRGDVLAALMNLHAAALATPEPRKAETDKPECPECGVWDRWRVSGHKRGCSLAWDFGDERPPEPRKAEGIDVEVLAMKAEEYIEAVNQFTHSRRRHVDRTGEELAELAAQALAPSADPAGDDKEERADG